MRVLRILFLVICVPLVAAGSGCAASWSQEVRFTRVKHYAPESAPGERIAYLALGDSCEFRKCAGHNDGGLPILVFVHGLGASKYFWKDVAYVMLHQHGYRAVLVDLLGHGDAAKPRKADYGPRAQGRRLAAFVRDNGELLGGRVVFVGTSYGAVSALEAVLQLQQTKAVDGCTPKVVGVFSVSAPAYYYPALEEVPDTLKNLRNPPLVARLVFPLFHTRFFERVILERSMWHEERILEADREEIRCRYGYLQRNARKALGRATLHLLEELKKRAGQHDYFKNLRCPVTVVGGAQDEIVPTRVQEKLAATIKGSRLVVLDDCGHAVAQDQPLLLVKSLTEFLTNRVGETPRDDQQP